MALQDDLLNNFANYRRVREDYEPLWDDITKLLNQRREGISEGLANINETPGQKRGKRSFDGTANGALNIWTSGILGAMVSRSRRWFKTTLSSRELGEVDEVRQWLQAYDEHIFDSFSRSNFYTQLLPWTTDAGSIGTATMFAKENLAKKITSYTAIHPREVYISENEFNEVDTVYRHFKITALKAKEMFTKEGGGNTGNLAETIIDAAKKTPLTEFEFLHCVYPNNGIQFGKSGNSNKPWRSVYLQFTASGPAGEKIVRESGFSFNPYNVWNK